MIRRPWGDLQLSVLSAGTLWLDGGAMFGVVPKPLWSRLREPDEQNRICLGMNLLLIEDGERRILVDTGAGQKWDEKSKAIYRIEAVAPESYLGPLGLGPDDIDVVINSHLHFDHAGGNTRLEGERLVSAFPNAEFFVQRAELELARQQNERIRASYDPDNFEPIAERFRLSEGATSLFPGVSVEPAPGHTPGMQMILVEGGGETLCFLADLVPTTSHVRYPYIMGYDLEPLRTLASKKEVLPRALREGWLLLFEHDHDLPLATLREENGRMAVEPWRADG